MMLKQAYTHTLGRKWERVYEVILSTSRRTRAKQRIDDKRYAGNGGA